METARLILRPPRLADGEPYHQMRNSLYVMRYNAMEPISMERALERIMEDQGVRPRRAFYLEERATGRLAGAVWLPRDSLRPQVEAVSLEYFLGEGFAGRGLMTEALEALLPYAFYVLGAQVVSARVFVENRASQRVLEKLGFVYEGTLRRSVKGWRKAVYDDMLFSLLREEFEHGTGGVSNG